MNFQHLLFANKCHAVNSASILDASYLLLYAPVGSKAT